MSNSAILRLNDITSKWEAWFGNVKISEGYSAEYIRKYIEGGGSARAKKLGVTQVIVEGAANEEHVAQALQQQVRQEQTPHIQPVTREQTAQAVNTIFDINERFNILNEYTCMVARMAVPSAIIVGQPGLGKSFSVLKALESCGIKNFDTFEDPEAKFNLNKDPEDGEKYTTIPGYSLYKGHSTPKALYRALYQNRNSLIVFDDCDSVLKDPTAVNLLKGALDSYDKRTISWLSERNSANDDIPLSFDFNGGVIFISNMQKHNLPHAIRTRAFCADVSMSRKETIERMKKLVLAGEFLPNYNTVHKLEALDFLFEHVDNPLIKEFNFRTLVNVVKIRAGASNIWQRLSLYSLLNA